MTNTSGLESFASEFLQSLETPPKKTAGSAIDSARKIIARHRRDTTAWLGFDHHDISAIRQRVTPEEQVRANDQFENALTDDLFMPYHNNAFAALGPITLNLVMDEAQAIKLQQKVMDNDHDLGESRWKFGETAGVCDLISFLWKNDRVPDEVFIPLFAWLHRQSRSEWAYMSTITEAALGNAGHNWWIHSYYGFWFLGTFFAFLKGTAKFKMLVPNYYEWELRNLFENDGWSIEESPNYHLHAARYAFKIHELCQKNAIDIGDQSQHLIHNVARSMIKLLTPDLQYPGFSDAVVGPHYQGFSEYQRPDLTLDIYLRRIAALHRLGDLKYVLENLSTENGTQHSVWGYLGNLQEAYDSLSETPPEANDMCLPDNGLYTMRDDWTANANFLAIQAGYAGTAEKSHKQSDLFNFELYSHGERVIVDNWYGPSGEMSEDRRPRMWRISTDAHNTVAVDGEDQLEIINEWRYGNVVLPIVAEWESTQEYCYFHGVHDAYSRLKPDSVPSHRRKIFYLRNHMWILIDRLIPRTPASHDYDLLFHLKPEAEISPDQRIATKADTGNVLLIPWCNHELNLSLHDNPYPWPGYENPQQLRCTATCSGAIIFVTVIVPFQGKTAPHVTVEYPEVQADDRILHPWEATALTVQTKNISLNYTDLHTHWNLPWQAGSMQDTCRRRHEVNMNPQK